LVKTRFLSSQERQLHFFFGVLFSTSIIYTKLEQSVIIFVHLSYF